MHARPYLIVAALTVALLALAACPKPVPCPSPPAGLREPVFAKASIRCGTDEYTVTTGTLKGRCTTTAAPDGSANSATCSDDEGNSASATCSDGKGRCTSATGAGVCDIEQK